MPQMACLMWLVLMLIFTFIFVFFIISMYFKFEFMCNSVVSYSKSLKFKVDF